jgi:hypothetical protein
MTGLMRGSVVLMALVTVMLAAASAEAVQSPPQPADFGEWLLARDLVVVCTVDSARRANRTPRGDKFPVPGVELALRVESVWLGTAEDSVLEVFVMGPTDSSSIPRKGSRLLAWPFRYPDDGWRLWAFFADVSSRGEVLLRGGEYGVTKPTSPLFLEGLHMMTRGRSFAHSTTNVEGRRALALGRLTKIVERPEGGYTYVCDSLDFVVGSAPRFPRYVDFPLTPDCWPGIFPGDSLIVPVPDGFTSTRVTLRACPNALAVKREFLPGFGVLLSQLRRALSEDNDGLHVRPFLQPDGR